MAGSLKTLLLSAFNNNASGNVEILVVAGGGAGGRTSSGSGGTYATYTGGGGGGGGGLFCSGTYGGIGGSGIVIIKYPDSNPAAITTGSPTVTVTGGSRIYQFTGSGTIEFV